ncbi:MAG TPA: YbaY family lipoprotein [Vicinamibacterales bacterium]|nr:YbaY family lipoprotein [Vicinamibacterales bacterium]
MKLLRTLGVLAMVVTAPALAAAQVPQQVAGTITYREKVALPPTATVEVRLEDVTRPDATAVIASTFIDRPGQVPIPFELPFDPDAIDARGRYAVRATIQDGDTVLFTSRDTVLVLTLRHGTRADLHLTRVAITAPPRQAPPPPPAPPPQPARPVHALPALPATFTGSVVCADCPKMQSQLNLYPDDSFVSRMTVTGLRTTGTTDDIGSWVLSSDRTVLILKGQGDSLDMFTIGPGGSLKRLEPKPLPGHLPNDMTHAAAFKPLPVDLPTIRGAYVQADRPTFIECSTGQTWLVADEGAAADVEAAYLKARLAPGASVLIEIEGAATPGPGPDGAGTSLVIRKLKRTMPAEACDPRYTNAPLTSTEWRLTALGTQTVAAASDPRRERSLIFDVGDTPFSGGYSGSSGCNRLVGTYSASDTAMTLTAGGTLIACKDQAQAESAFLTALKGTARYRISGQMLELFDASGTRLARFEARVPTGTTKR